MSTADMTALVTALATLVTAIAALVGVIRHVKGPAHQDAPNPRRYTAADEARIAAEVRESKPPSVQELHAPPVAPPPAAQEAQPKGM